MRDFVALSPETLDGIAYLIISLLEDDQTAGLKGTITMQEYRSEQYFSLTSTDAFADMLSGAFP